MPFPASSGLLALLIQASDGLQTETVTVPASGPYTYRLGANASPALPPGLQRVPKGAFPLLAPLVIPAATAIQSVGHALAPNSVYKYALTNVTRNGETTADNVFSFTTWATIAGSTGVLLTLPSVTASASNPVTLRRLYRSKAGLTALQWCADIIDLSLTSWADGRSDDDLGVAPPATNASGLPAVVTITGGGYGGSFTEKAQGIPLIGGDFTADYSYSPTGGLVSFAAVDASKTVTIVYTATTAVNGALVNSLVTAVKDTAGWVQRATPTRYTVDLGLTIGGAPGYTPFGQVYGFGTTNANTKLLITLTVPLRSNTNGDLSLFLSCTATPAGAGSAVIPSGNIGILYSGQSQMFTASILVDTTQLTPGGGAPGYYAFRFQTATPGSSTAIWNPPIPGAGVTLNMGHLDIVEIVG